MARCVGIDLGTSNSVVAAMVGGRPTVIPDEEGHTIQSSVVSFLEDGTIIVGNRARARKVVDPINTIYSAKRLIGRPYFSNEVRVAETHYPYQVVRGHDENPKIIGQGQEYSPEEISALVLQRMKQIAENYLGERIEQAIITVPANFNEAQRTATKLAGDLAGLEVLRILNEPTAAALAYGYGLERRERVAIYDFGGGTFDVTLLELRGAVFEVLSTAGNTYLGGDDFDNRLADYMLAAFKRKHGLDLSDNLVAVQRLKNVAERVKIDLSADDKTSVQFVQPAEDGTPLELSFSITRDGFSQRCGDIVAQTFVVCDDALRLANVTSAEVEHVVLVGGTTRMPLVRQMVADYFFKQPVGDINPDEVVAVGAAIYASSLEEQHYAPAGATAAGPQITERAKSQGQAPPPSNRDALLIDVTPQSLGITTAGGFTDTIIERNENIPTERSRVFTTSNDYQTVVRLQIVEGDSKRSEENVVLGELELLDIRSAPRGEVEIEVTFEIDTDGILNVSAVDRGTQHVQTTQLHIHGQLSQQEVERIKSSDLPNLPMPFDADDEPPPELLP